MSHAIGAVLFTTEKPDAKLMKIVDIRSVIEMTLNNMQNPVSTYYMMNHAMTLLATPTLHCPTICKSNPSLLKFLVACLRSKDLTVRCTAIGGLIRLHDHEAKPGMVFHDPRKLVASISKGFSDHIVEIMMDYGLGRCDTYATLQATREFQEAMMMAVEDQDILKLAYIIAELIMRTEFSITEGKFETVDGGLPFTMWTDSLPFCAASLRQKGEFGDLNMADVIELKYLIIKQKIPEAINLAKAAINRSPDIAYYYYAISLGANDEDGLRYAKKGLKCKIITPFLKFALLYRSVEHAGNMAVTKLQEASQGDKNYEEGSAFLASALDDSREFVRSGPPDSRHMQNMLNWYIILMIAYKGPELTLKLDELQDAIKKLELTSEIAQLVGLPIVETLMRLTRKTVLEHYKTGVKEWGDVITRFDDLSAEEPGKIPKEKLEDDLASWLDELHVDDIEEEKPTACSHPKINPNRVELYRCSWCGNPSSILRKCRACGLTKYCDQICQKQHWSKHRTACNQAGAK